jgi:hypothetical protein
MGRITADDAMPTPPPEKQALYAKLTELFDLQDAERVASTEREGFSTDEVKRRLQSLAEK